MWPGMMFYNSNLEQQCFHIKSLKKINVSSMLLYSIPSRNHLLFLLDILFTNLSTFASAKEMAWFSFVYWCLTIHNDVAHTWINMLDTEQTLCHLGNEPMSGNAIIFSSSLLSPCHQTHYWHFVKSGVSCTYCSLYRIIHSWAIADNINIWCTKRGNNSFDYSIPRHKCRDD